MKTFAEQWFEFGPRAWLVAYDIADPSRLNRVHRFLKACAIPIQYSVFLGWFSDAELQAVATGIERRIDPRRDDVRMYHLPSRTLLYRLGRQWLPEQVYLVGDTWHVATPETVGSPPDAKPGDPRAKSLAGVAFSG